MTTAILIFASTLIIFWIIASKRAAAQEKKHKAHLVLIKNARARGKTSNGVTPGYHRKSAKHHYR